MYQIVSCEKIDFCLEIVTHPWGRTSASHHKSKLQSLECMFMWSLFFDNLCLKSKRVGSLVYVLIYINFSLFWSCVHSTWSIELYCLNFLFLYFNFTLLHWIVVGEQFLFYFHIGYYETWISIKHFLKPVFIY